MSWVLLPILIVGGVVLWGRLTGRATASAPRVSLDSDNFSSSDSSSGDSGGCDGGGGGD